jgi:Bacterial alpha-L-rhamnosidase 6 hairpin glycosidase domain
VSLWEKSPDDPAIRMKRRNFIKNSMLTGAAISLPGIVTAIPFDKTPSPFLKIIPDTRSPQFSFFSIDSLGKNNLKTNIILQEEGKPVYKTNIQGDRTSYTLASPGNHAKPVWEVTAKKTGFILCSNFEVAGQQAFLFIVEQHLNHATLLGMMEGPDGAVTLPAILHFPDMGTLRITCNVPGITVRYSSQRFIEHPFVKIQFPAATSTHPKVEYHFEVVTIHPEVKGIQNDERYDGFRKNFISIFQLNPLLKILSNNSSSDACAFTLFKYAEVAAYTPPFVKGLSALDLVRMTLDRYLGGQKGYGMLGYDYDKTWDIRETATTCNSLDTYPSLLIAACTYAIANKDQKWFKENYPGIKTWSAKMLAADKDNDGLLEFCLSGNSGSWKGDKTQRPANWWDTIGFAHKDAYSNALAYHALKLLEKVNTEYGSEGEAIFFKERAKKLKNVYTTTFYNPESGVLAGWKSGDGQLHDYYFTFVNGVAISYGLIDPTLSNSIMDKLLVKMKAAGFTNFELGMPGNLVPVIRADYTDLLLEVGGGKREDNLDGFQIYENGGATACFTYFTIRALQRLGRKEDADAILFPLLKSMSEGNFQGRCQNGRSKDWKTWTGECWGYEGFLVDNYMFLLAVLERSGME